MTNGISLCVVSRRFSGVLLSTLLFTATYNAANASPAGQQTTTTKPAAPAPKPAAPAPHTVPSVSKPASPSSTNGKQHTVPGAPQQPGFGQGSKQPTGTQQPGFGQGKQPTGTQQPGFGQGKQPVPQQHSGVGQGSTPGTAADHRGGLGPREPENASRSASVHNNFGPGGSPARPVGIAAAAPPGGREHQVANGMMVTHQDARVGRSAVFTGRDGSQQVAREMPGVSRFSQTVRPDRTGRPMVITSYGRSHVVVVRQVAGHPGFERHSYRVGDHSYAVVYRDYRYHGYGFARPVPAYVYAPGFYAWGFQPWSQVTYSWGWDAQPWYGAYGRTFNPYPSYAGLDLWMTDYIIATNMQREYEANQGPPVSGNSYVSDSGPAAPPPQITDDMKAEIAAQVKLEIEEQQRLAAQGANAAAGPPATASETEVPEDTPDALKPGHNLFRVVSPLAVKVNGQDCNLTTNDYINRVGNIDDKTGLVSVKVRTSRSVDCPAGGTTSIALTDLMVMESDQQERVQEGFQLAAQNMGKNGLPKGPSPGATPVPGGQAVPDSGLLDALHEQQADADRNLKQAAALDRGSI